MSFLAHEGFDFNKWVRQGISYMPLKLYEQRTNQVSSLKLLLFRAHVSSLSSYPLCMQSREQPQII